MADGISLSLNGVANAVSRITTAATNIAQPAADANLAKNLLDANVAGVDYTANIKVLKAQLDDEKKILDILA